MIYHGDAYEYVVETPLVLQKILNGQKDILGECDKYLKDKQITEIYLTGSGSSYHSALVSAKFIKHLLGIPVSAVYPADVMEEVNQINDQTLLVGISQQGTSMAVIKALDQMKEKGGLTISCTGEYDTEITRHSHANIYVECGPEDAGATTKGFTATIFTLNLLGLHLAEMRQCIDAYDWKVYERQMEESITNMEQVIKHCDTWCQKVSEKLVRCRDLIILVSGRYKGLLPEIILKFSETCRMPVRGYEAEEFMHGMYNAVNDETEFLCLFDGESAEDERLQKLCEYYQNHKNRVYCLNSDVAQNLPGYFTKGNMFSVLENILPLQILFIYTSKKRGIDLNRPKDPDFHKYMQSKIEE